MIDEGSKNSWRTAAASGTAFVVLFIGGAIPLGPLLGSFADSDGTFDAYFSNSSNRTGNIIGGVLLAASAFVFLWFLQHLRHSLLPTTTDAAALPNFVQSSGQTYVTLLLVGTAALVTVPITLAFASLTDDQPLAVGQAVLPQLGYVVIALFANWAAAGVELSTTVSARRTHVFPRWLCRLGYVVTAFLLLFGLTGGLALFALPIWVLAVSTHWWRLRECGKDGRGDLGRLALAQATTTRRDSVTTACDRTTCCGFYNGVDQGTAFEPSHGVRDPCRTGVEAPWRAREGKEPSGRGGPGGPSLSARRSNGTAFESLLGDKRPIEILEGPQISAIDALSLSLVLLGQPRSVVTR